MERFVKRFWIEENGNATADWMVMTAGLVLLAAAVMATLSPNAQTAIEDTPPVTQAIKPAADV